MEQRPKKLMENLQDTIRLSNYSYKTGKSYIAWIRGYVFTCFYATKPVPN